jgi:hypothetical protein
MMRIKPGDDVNAAIKKVCERSTRAGCVIALIQREYPETTLAYLKAIDSKGIYGHMLADFYFKDCSGDIDVFLKRIAND